MRNRLHTKAVSDEDGGSKGSTGNDFRLSVGLEFGGSPSTHPEDGGSKGRMRNGFCPSAGLESGESPSTHPTRGITVIMPVGRRAGSGRIFALPSAVNLVRALRPTLRG